MSFAAFQMEIDVLKLLGLLCIHWHDYFLTASFCIVWEKILALYDLAVIISGGWLPVTTRWWGAVSFNDEQHPCTVTSAAAVKFVKIKYR